MASTVHIIRGSLLVLSWFVLLTGTHASSSSAHRDPAKDHLRGTLGLPDRKAYAVSTRRADERSQRVARRRLAWMNRLSRRAAGDLTGFRAATFRGRLRNLVGQS
jgi:hypothetical protein